MTSILIFAGCATPKDYSKFNAANPNSILVVPVVNKSVDVTAADYLLSTISIPVAEQGYYVFPVNMVKRVLEDEGLYDADLVHKAQTSKLCNMFGSDAVLYISIERWDAKYSILSTKVTVELNYVIKDGKTGDVLWEQNEKIAYVPQSSNTGSLLGNIIADTVTAAVTKASPNYIPLARKANGQAFKYPGPGIPPGPYQNRTSY
jgi:hypothetical protein